MTRTKTIVLDFRKGEVRYVDGLDAEIEKIKAQGTYGARGATLPPKAHD